MVSAQLAQWQDRGCYSGKVAAMCTSATGGQIGFSLRALCYRPSYPGSAVRSPLHEASQQAMVAGRLPVFRLSCAVDDWQEVAGLKLAYAEVRG